MTSGTSSVVETVLDWWAISVMPVAHRLPPDDGRCDFCGSPRETGYLRLEGGRCKKYLLPEVGRYCLDCRLNVAREQR